MSRFHQNLHVLEAIRLNEREAKHSARFSVSNRTTIEEIDAAVGYFADYLETTIARGAAE